MNQCEQPQIEPSLSNAVIAIREDSTLASSEAIQRMLKTLRTHVGLQVAFVSQFKDGNQWYRFVDSVLANPNIEVGSFTALENTYCMRVADGRIPALIPDTLALDETRNLDATKEANIGSYISAPIRFSDQTVYGTLCCVGTEANPTLADRDLSVVKMMADLLGERLEREALVELEETAKRKRVQEVLDNELLSLVYQPIVHTDGIEIAGYEALMRVGANDVSPAAWLKMAHGVGLGGDLERMAARMALESLDGLSKSQFLSINMSPEVLVEPLSLQLFFSYPLESVVIEITEHAEVHDYPSLVLALESLKAAGAKIAIDDAGAGYASFNHILQIRPDIIKLDMSLTTFLSTDLARQALVRAFIYFATVSGSKLIGEGVEYRADADMLFKLGVQYGQGYFFATPNKKMQESLLEP